MRYVGSKVLIENAKSVTTQGDPDAGDPTVGNAIFGSAYANAVWVGITGEVTLSLINGSTVVYQNQIAGQWANHPPFKNIAFSGATADVLVGITFKSG